MAVPKSKISNSRRGMRRAHQSLSNAKIVEDKDSGEMRLSHNIDMSTGMYNGKKIFTPKEASDCWYLFRGNFSYRW